jgi:hypothetical protein
MMTKLCETIMECLAIEIDDRVILYGWAAQLEEGNDTLYCSKDTVAVFLGVSVDTIKRRTKRLLGKGLLIDTGERKQWSTGWTPVLRANVPMIMGSVVAQPCNLHPRAECTPVQIAPQVSGSRFSGLSGFRFSGLSSSPSYFTSKAVERVEERTENREPKTVEPKPKPEPTPTPHGHNSCPDCGELFQRHTNHLLVCKVANPEKSSPDSPGSDPLDDYQPPTYDWGEDDDEGDEASHAQPPVAPDPLYLCMVCEKQLCRSPSSDHCTGCWNNGSPMAIPKGAVPKTVPNYSINR